LATVLYFAVVLVFVRTQRSVETFMARKFGFA